MENSARSLGWLRGVDRTLHDATMPADPLGAGVASGLIGQRTPAWTERSVAAMDRLVDALAGNHDTATDRAWWTSARPTLLVLRGIRSMICRDDSPGHPAETSRGEAANPVWAHRDLAEELSRSWRDEPPPPGAIDGTLDATTTQVTVAGLGLRLHDHRFGTELYPELFEPWWRQAREAVLAVAVAVGDSGNAAAGAVMRTALYLAPGAPGDARQLFDAATAGLQRGFGGTLPVDAVAAGLLLAREWALRDLADTLAELVDHTCAAAWDDERSEFAWGAGPAESLLAAAEACAEGQWTSLTSVRSASTAQVLDVDFPALGLRRAEWTDGFLHLRLDPRHEDRAARSTFRLVGAEPRVWWVSGAPDVTVEMRAREVTIRVPMLAATIEFAPSSY